MSHQLRLQLGTHTKTWRGGARALLYLGAGGGALEPHSSLIPGWSLQLPRFLPFLRPQKPAYPPATSNPDTR